MSNFQAISRLPGHIVALLGHIAATCSSIVQTHCSQELFESRLRLTGISFKHFSCISCHVKIALLTYPLAFFVLALFYIPNIC